MSIRNFVIDAISLFQQGRFDSALSVACSAMDATAQKEYPGKQSSERCRNFIDDNMEIITAFTFWGPIFTKKFKQCFPHPEAFKGAPKYGPDSRGLVELSSIIYCVIRCELTHDAELGKYVTFVNESNMTYDAKTGTLIMPKSLLCGILAAVVASPKNNDQISKNPFKVKIGDDSFCLDDFWGDKTHLLDQQKKIKGKYVVAPEKP